MSQEYYWYLDVNAEVNKRIVDELMFEKNIFFLKLCCKLCHNYGT